jgi:hypothetical protein
MRNYKGDNKKMYNKNCDNAHKDLKLKQKRKEKSNQEHNLGTMKCWTLKSVW